MGSLAAAAPAWRWGNPWVIPLFALEAALLGHFSKPTRCKAAWRVVLGFWLVAGCPILAWYYHAVRPVAWPTYWILLLKHPVNSMIIAAGADVLVRSERLRRVFGAAPLGAHRERLRVTLTRGQAPVNVELVTSGVGPGVRYSS